MKYIAIIDETANGYSAYLPDLPGCIAAGDTLEETAQLIREAAMYHVEAMLEDSDPIPPPRTIAVSVEVALPAEAQPA